MTQPREPILPDAVYSCEDVARLIGVDIKTLKRLIASGDLSASRPGGAKRILIRGADIFAMLEKSRIIPKEM